MNSGATSPLSPKNSVKILAHRGLVSEFVPENTLKAFADAIDAGADVIETDVQATSDGVAVIFHDADLLRLAGVNKKISQVTWSELQGIDIGFGKRVIDLERALLAFPKTIFNLDIKSDAALIPTVSVIENLNAHSQVLISSFSEKRRLRAIKLLTAPVQTSAGVTKVLKLLVCSLLGSQKLFNKVALGSSALQVPTHRGPIRLDSPRYIKMAKSCGLEVHFWTINNSAEMLRLASLGATGIVTDHCDDAVATLR